MRDRPSGSVSASRRVDSRFLLPNLPTHPIAWDSEVLVTSLHAASGRHQGSVATVDAIFTHKGARPVSGEHEGLPRVVEHDRPWIIRRMPENSATWLVVVDRDRPVAYVPAGRPVLLRHAVAHWQPARPVTRTLKRVLRTVPRVAPLLLHRVAVTAPDRIPVPAIVAAARDLGAPEVDAAYLLTDGGSELRRVAALLFVGGEVEPRYAAKLERHPSDQRRSTAEHAGIRLAANRSALVHVPQQLGVADLSGHALVLEEAARGMPLAPFLSTAGSGSASAVADLSTWLTDLAVATVHPQRGSSVQVAEIEHYSPALRPVLQAMLALLDGGKVPAVLVHGDLALGNNVLVTEQGDLSVVDWETARPHGAPLEDLVQLLVTATAVLDGPAGDDREREAVGLAIATGASRHSASVFSAISTYLAALGLDPALAGPLALSGWLHHALAHHRHRDLLRAAGLEASQGHSWTVNTAGAWVDHPDLGVTWPAFTRWLGQR